MPDSVAPLTPAEGLSVVHLFLRTSPLADAAEIHSAVEMARAAGNQVVCVATLGHKSDLCFMVLGADQWSQRRFQTALAAAGLDLVDSYVSLTETSEYAKGLPDEMKNQRLYPELPPEGKAAFCFYPMSKRRGLGADHNWYTLPFDDRRDLMYEHGTSGRKFAGRIVQLITASTGLDDWEWGVTLFGQRPDDLKDVVYTMRFDEASAVYAEFGPFITGMVADLDDVLAAVGVVS